MFNASFSNLLVDAHVEELHRAARNTGTRRRPSAVAALATVVTRTPIRTRQS